MGKEGSGSRIPSPLLQATAERWQLGVREQRTSAIVSEEQIYLATRTSQVCLTLTLVSSDDHNIIYYSRNNVRIIQKNHVLILSFLYVKEGLARPVERRTRIATQIASKVNVYFKMNKPLLVIHQPNNLWLVTDTTRNESLCVLNRR